MRNFISHINKLVASLNRNIKIDEKKFNSLYNYHIDNVKHKLSK